MIHYLVSFTALIVITGCLGDLPRHENNDPTRFQQPPKQNLSVLNDSEWPSVANHIANNGSLAPTGGPTIVSVLGRNYGRNQSRTNLSRTRSNSFPPYYGNNGYRRSDIYGVDQPGRPVGTRYDCSNDYGIKFYWLSLQWPGGFCTSSPERCQKEVNHWTIHGMWASYSAHQSAEFCCFSNTYDPSKLTPIQADLQEYWPSLFGSSRPFWSHEWLKHGTCARNTPDLKGELQFFQTTLKIFEQLNIDGALTNFKPSETLSYNLEDMRKAIETQTGGKKVSFTCDLTHEDPVPVIAGMYVCYDNNLNIIDCPRNDIRCKSRVKLPPASPPQRNGRRISWS